MARNDVLAGVLAASFRHSVCRWCIEDALEALAQCVRVPGGAEAVAEAVGLEPICGCGDHIRSRLGRLKERA